MRTATLERQGYLVLMFPGNSVKPSKQAHRVFFTFRFFSLLIRNLSE